MYLITLGGRCDGKRLESGAMVIRNSGAANRHTRCRNYPDRSGAFQEFLAGVEQRILELLDAELLDA